jgi:hypothetical protein
MAEGGAKVVEVATSIPEIVLRSTSMFWIVTAVAGCCSCSFASW